jgi:hypothetical protein
MYKFSNFVLTAQRFQSAAVNLLFCGLSTMRVRKGAYQIYKAESSISSEDMQGIKQ